MRYFKEEKMIPFFGEGDVLYIERFFKGREEH